MPADGGISSGSAEDIKKRKKSMEMTFGDQSGQPSPMDKAAKALSNTWDAWTNVGPNAAEALMGNKKKKQDEEAP